MSTWAQRAAQRILLEYQHKSPYWLGDSERGVTETIVKFAEPLIQLLRDSKHQHVSESMNCGALEDGPTGRDSRGSCTCGADEFNARIDAVLGEK